MYICTYTHSHMYVLFRQYWMPDDITVECYDCTSKVSMLRITNNNTKLNLYLQIIT